MNAGSHLKSPTGCKKCSKKLSKYKVKKTGYDNEGFKKKLNSIYGSIYNYDCTNYKDGQRVATIECKKHGKVRLGIKRLLNGRGCKKCNISKGELKIIKFLNENDIKYVHQKVFEDCRNIKPLPFDFYLPSYNLLIEFDGEQHDRPVKKFGGKKGFLKQRKHDEIKNNYAKTCKIKLLRIKYRNIGKIEQILKREIKNL